MSGLEKPAGYPLPWQWEEMWSGTRIVAANGRTVVTIRLGNQALHIDEEQTLAKQIVTAVNAGGLPE